jgi:site-specific recombinase XerD
MASVFKAKGATHYTVMWFDEDNRRRKKKGFTDKAESQRLANRLEDEARQIKLGNVDPREKKFRIHGTTPLADHMADYGRYLVAKGGTEKYANQTLQQAGKLLELARATRIGDLNLSKALEAVKALRDAELGAESINSYIRATKGFVRWLWRDGRAREHALVHLATTKGDLRHPRRALTPDEAALVVQAAEAGEEHSGMSGRERAMLYRVALGTGYRASELRSLTPERFNLAANPPTITCKACYTKNKKQAVQPIAQSLADLLRPWLAKKPRGAAVFERLPHAAADMLKIDLEVAGIPYETDSGVVDFHALRAAYISHLVSSGVSVKTCQTLARHANPGLTIGIYAKASLHDISGAVEGLPDLTATQPTTEKQVMAAAGTDPVQNCYFRSETTTDETTQVQFSQDVVSVLGVFSGDDALSSPHLAKPPTEHPLRNELDLRNPL